MDNRPALGAGDKSDVAKGVFDVEGQSKQIPQFRISPNGDSWPAGRCGVGTRGR